MWHPLSVVFIFTQFSFTICVFISVFFTLFSFAMSFGSSTVTSTNYVCMCITTDNTSQYSFQRDYLRAMRQSLEEADINSFMYTSAHTEVSIFALGSRMWESWKPIDR